MGGLVTTSNPYRRNCVPKFYVLCPLPSHPHPLWKTHSMIGGCVSLNYVRHCLPQRHFHRRTCVPKLWEAFPYSHLWISRWTDKSDTWRYCVPIPYRRPIGGHVPMNSRMHCALSTTSLDYLLGITLHVHFGGLVPLKYPLGDVCVFLNSGRYMVPYSRTFAPQFW